MSRFKGFRKDSSLVGNFRSFIAGRLDAAGERPWICFAQIFLQSANTDKNPRLHPDISWGEMKKQEPPIDTDAARCATFTHIQLLNHV